MFTNLCYNNLTDNAKVELNKIQSQLDIISVNNNSSCYTDNKEYYNIIQFYHYLISSPNYIKMKDVCDEIIQKYNVDLNTKLYHFIIILKGVYNYPPVSVLTFPFKAKASPIDTYGQFISVPIGRFFRFDFIYDFNLIINNKSEHEAINTIGSKNKSYKNINHLFNKVEIASTFVNDTVSFESINELNNWITELNPVHVPTLFNDLEFIFYFAESNKDILLDLLTENYIYLEYNCVEVDGEYYTNYKMSFGLISNGLDFITKIPDGYILNFENSGIVKCCNDQVQFVTKTGRNVKAIK